MHAPKTKPASGLPPLARLLQVLQRLNQIHDRWEMGRPQRSCWSPAGVR